MALAEPVSDTRVVYVDDNAAALAARADRLASVDGVSVVRTTDADRARRVVADGVDCVVSGYRVCDAAGAAFLRSLRREAAGLPVVVVGDLCDSAVDRLVATGPTDYVPRSLLADDVEPLADRIRTVVDRADERASAATAGDRTAGDRSAVDRAAGDRRTGETGSRVDSLGVDDGH